MYVYINISTYTYIYICKYTHIYIHIHIRRNLRQWYSMFWPCSFWVWFLYDLGAGLRQPGLPLGTVYPGVQTSSCSKGRVCHTKCGWVLRRRGNKLEQKHSSECKLFLTLSQLLCTVVICFELEGLPQGWTNPEAGSVMDYLSAIYPWFDIQEGSCVMCRIFENQQSHQLKSISVVALAGPKEVVCYQLVLGGARTGTRIPPVLNSDWQLPHV